MTDAEARALATRIINSIRSTPPHAEWIDALLPLDAGRAGTAFIRCRDDNDSDRLTIARFKMTYRSLHTASTDTARHGCWQCGDGWVTRNYQRGEREYRGAYPCTCPAGQENQRIWDDVNTHNDRSRRIIGLDHEATRATEIPT